MAKNYSEIYASIFDKKNKMDFSNAMIRGNGIPLDATEVYNSLKAAIKYAATDPVAYEGQLLAVTENGDTNVYVIGPVNQGNILIDNIEYANYLKLVGKETDLSNYYTKEQVDKLIPVVPSVSIIDYTKAEIPDTDTVNVYKNLTVNGHELSEEVVQVATAVGVENAITGLRNELRQEIVAGMTFKGTISSLPLQAEVGDTYKVYGENISIIVDGVNAKQGDTVIYGINKEANSGSLEAYKWYLIPSGDDIEDTWRPITGIGNNKTLTFSAGEKVEVSVKEEGTVTYSHKKIASPVLVEGGEGRTYITELISDEYGHIVGYKTSTETDQEIPEDTNTHYTLDAKTIENKVNIRLTNDSDDKSDNVSIVGEGAATVSQNSKGEIVVSAVDSQYKAGKGLTLKEGEFEVNTDGKAVVIDENGQIALKLSDDISNEGYLFIESDGLQIKGIDKAIQEAINKQYHKDTTYTLEALDTNEKVKITLTPSEGEIQTKELNVYNIPTLQTILYEGKYAGKDGDVVSNIPEEDKHNSRLISPDEIKKISALVIDEDGSVGISGTISAENVTGLSSAIENQVTGKNALNIAKGAEANIIESVTINNTPLEIKNKSVELPLATVAKAGIVKSSTAENGVAVTEDGAMSIVSVNINKLTQPMGEVLILDCGGAEI